VVERAGKENKLKRFSNFSEDEIQKLLDNKDELIKLPKNDLLRISIRKRNFRTDRKKKKLLKFLKSFMSKREKKMARLRSRESGHKAVETSLGASAKSGPSQPIINRATRP
jgi:hypothetical protein